MSIVSIKPLSYFSLMNWQKCQSFSLYALSFHVELVWDHISQNSLYTCSCN